MASNHKAPKQERSMTLWLKENALALLLVIASAAGTWTLAVNRITVLELKVEQQAIRSDKAEQNAAKTDDVIVNNTQALNNVAVVFAQLNGKLDQHEYRIHEIEEEIHE